MRHVIVLLAATLATVGCTTKAPLTMSQSPHSMTRTVKHTYNTNYLVYLPKDYETRPDWPMILFLHGSGERGSDLTLVAKHGTPSQIAAGEEFPFVVISPQCPEGLWWDPYELDALMDQVVEDYNVDSNRLYLTGLSMGGYGTWALATHNPDRFAAMAPICGGGNDFIAARLKNIPTWAFHGEKDTVVLPSESKKMVDAINQAGGNAKLTLYPDATHNSWTRTYNNPELYEWFLSNRKP